MAIELKIQVMTLDGIPLGCPDCGTNAFSLDGRGPIDALATVWATCANYHSWEHPMLTVADLRAIDEVRTGRQSAEDIDTFEIVIGGAVLAGVLQPEVTIDDLKRVARDVYWQRIIKPAMRRRKNAAKRALVRPIKNAGRNAVAAAKATALETAWTAQAGGYEPDPDYTPEPVTPCPACGGKGEHRLKTRLHDTTRVRCSVCHGTGEID